MEELNPIFSLTLPFFIIIFPSEEQAEILPRDLSQNHPSQGWGSEHHIHQLLSTGIREERAGKVGGKRGGAHLHGNVSARFFWIIMQSCSTS